MLTATYDPGALFGACLDSAHAPEAVLGLDASGLFGFVGLPGALAAPALPHLAVAATLALGLGALVATLVYGVLPRAGHRAVALVVFLPLIAWCASILCGLRHPAEAAGLLALGCLGVAAIPATLGNHAPVSAPWAVGWSRAGALLLVAWALDGAAAGWGLFPGTPPWSPGVAARLLDVSPRTFAMEIAGFDWMRHPSIYESVGTDRISPALRPPFGRGALGGAADHSAGYAAWGRVVAVLPAIVVGSLVTAIRLYRSSKPSANPR